MSSSSTTTDHCLLALAELKDQVASSGSSALVVTDVDDQIGRLRVWHSDVVSARQSFGQKLSRSASISGNINKLLDELLSNTLALKAIVTGARLPYEQQDRPQIADEDVASQSSSSSHTMDFSPEPQTELEYRYGEIVDIIDHLYRQSGLMRGMKSSNPPETPMGSTGSSSEGVQPSPRSKRRVWRHASLACTPAPSAAMQKRPSDYSAKEEPVSHSISRKRYSEPSVGPTKHSATALTDEGLDDALVMPGEDRGQQGFFVFSDKSLKFEFMPNLQADAVQHLKEKRHLDRVLAAPQRDSNTSDGIALSLPNQTAGPRAKHLKHFLPEDRFDREVLVWEIGNCLDGGADIVPAVHAGRRGYYIHTDQTLSMDLINTMEDYSTVYRKEKWELLKTTPDRKLPYEESYAYRRYSGRQLPLLREPPAVDGPLP